MKRIIVAIGGGENGRLLKNGVYASYDTEKIDKEIVSLTNKKNPNYLFIGHALFPNTCFEENYYQTMTKIYGDMLKCNCDILYSNELTDLSIVEKKLSWADIIYEGGGDTANMIDLWQKTGFDKRLFNEWSKGKIICGISAGAVCWFKSANSGSKENSFTSVECLNWLNYHFTPHCDEIGRKESTKLQLKDKDVIGIMISNGCAIEIVDNKFKIIKESPNSKAYKAFWENNEYYEIELNNLTMEKIDELL